MPSSIIFKAVSSLKNYVLEEKMGIWKFINEKYSWSFIERDFLLIYQCKEYIVFIT